MPSLDFAKGGVLRYVAGDLRKADNLACGVAHRIDHRWPKDAFRLCGSASL
jgi:hypothetical protein